MDFDCLDEQDRTLLTSCFTKEEILEGLMDCKGDKASGPNSFNMNFLQNNWSTTEGDLIELFNKFHKTETFVKSLNSTFLVLIPNVEGATCIKDFRPNLVSGIYKIIAKVFAKVLAKRMSKDLNKVMGVHQHAFMFGRQIKDVALIAYEVVDSLLEDGTRGVLCKLDMEKAYDYVAWNFLLYMLKRLGFGEK